mgnify:CR=1
MKTQVMTFKINKPYDHWEKILIIIEKFRPLQ